MDIPVCLSINLLEDILVVSNFLLMNEASVNICEHNLSFSGINAQEYSC